MSYIKAIFVLMIILLPTQTYAKFIHGWATCEGFLKNVDERDVERMLHQDFWIRGFLSGVNQFSLDLEILGIDLPNGIEQPRELPEDDLYIVEILIKGCNNNPSSNTLDVYIEEHEWLQND
jgi:hypothetical protein